MPHHIQRPTQRRKDALGHHHCIVGNGNFTEHDHEFVSTQPAHRIDVPHDQRQTIGDGLQQSVANVVS